MCTPQCIIEKVGCLAFDEAVKSAIKAGKYVIDCTTNLEKLQAEMRSLQGRSEIIEGNIHEANHRGEEVYNAVLHWRTNTDMMTRDVQELVGQSSGMVNMSCVACSCPNIKQRYRLSKQAEEKIAAVQKLTQDSHFDKISHPKPPPPELEFPSNVKYVNWDSRTPLYKHMMDALKDPSVSVIGVHGLGGVGKTTLVKEVGKKMRHDGTFKQVALAVVSKDLNVQKIQSQLADSLDFKWDANSDDQKGRANQLWHKFTNGERYLVILDDVWTKVDITAIGIPLIKGSTTGCKVVLTSRDKDLLVSRMNVDKPFPIEELQEPEAWTLFKEKVGDSIESQLELHSLAYEVCKKCKGLPVAINALGEALKGKPNDVWKDALVKLKSYMITNIEGIDPSVWASLKLSYDMLWSSNAKSCFLLCCLFHEDVEISIDDLMRHCVARSLLSPNPRTLEEAKIAVRTLVLSLKSVSLLSNGNDENVVRIHDVIRDVGISIAHKEEAFLVDHGVVRWPRNPTNEPLYSAISISFEDIKWLPDGLKYPQLHTLMVDNSELSNVKFPDNFFNGMTQLIVLTITEMRMWQLPSSLAKLTKLRMLYLNGCKLADIAILKGLKCNLEVLSLRGSSIKALPSEIGELTNLRVLDLQHCDELMVIPRGVIFNLTGLEELYFPMTFDKWKATIDKEQDASSKDNASLEELKGSLANGQLTTLHIHVPDVKLLPKENLIFANLKGFRISVGSEFYYFEELISRTCMLKLEGIQLRNEFLSLVDKAEVLFLKRGSSVHPLRLFNKLTVLTIEHFKLKYLCSSTTARGLVHLEKLVVTSCEIMEGIIGFEGQNDENEIIGEVKFSKLKLLQLTRLPNLTSFYAKKEKMETIKGSSSASAQTLFNEKVIFPVLEELTIVGLGNIIKIWDKRSIVEFEGEIDEDGNRNEVAYSTGEHLEIVGVTEIQDKQPLLEPRKEVESLCKLMRISIEECDQLLYVFPSHMLPHNLQELYIGNCNELEVIFSKDPKEEKEAIDDDIIVFPRLKEVRLRKLRKLKSFYTETQGFFSHKVAFPVLEKLSLDNLDKITRIWDNQPLSELEKEAKSFSELKNICVHGCRQLEYLLPSNMLPQLKNILQVLCIWFCTKMEVIISNNPKEKEATNNNDTIRFPQLKEVWLWDLPNLKSFICSDETQLLFSNKVAFPVLKRLLLAKLDKIIRIWDNQPLSEPEKEAKSFCELTEIIVDLCDQLEYVLSSYMLPQLKNLQKLDIRDCAKMEVIISNNPTEKEATNNNDSIQFPQLKTALFWGLPNLKSFIYSDETQLLFSNKVDFLVLKTLKFKNLHKITRIWDNQPLSEPEKEAKSFCQLMKIEVDDCDQLEYVLPLYMLPQLKNLQRLHIEDCTKMEVIISNNPKEKEATNNNDTIRFPQLKKVELWGSPNLKSFICSETQLFFSNKDAFPVLEEIDLDEDSEILRDGTYMEEVSMENNKLADTSAAQARKGKDIQEIPWGRLNITREKYRQTRLEQYENYEGIPQSGEGSKKDCKVTMKGGMYYEFRRNSRSVKSTILHRQCRDFVWATSKHDVYFMSYFSVTHWSALTRNKTEVLNVSGHVAPCEKHPGSLLEGFTRTEVSTLAVKDRLLVAGGFQGELICKNLDRPGVCFCTRATYDDNALTNVVEIYNTQSGAVHLTVAYNDRGVRDFDMEKFQLSKQFSFPWPVNHTSLSPDGKLRVIVGDNPEGMLVDSGTGKMVASLVGHLDFSLASAWHPDGLTFATGNQDKTCRIWDARNLSKSVAALRGNLGAIQPIRYSSDGRFMAMAEPADFVHVFDVKSGYEKEQEIDFFGEIYGMSFSPDTESLFIGVCDAIEACDAIGVSDRTYDGLLEFGRRRNNSCPDSII